jgi:hypothetical protein
MDGGVNESSHTLGYYRKLKGKLVASYRDSLVSRTFQGLSTAVRNSWLVTWLTTGPQPDVIVIDLRDTYTVGPFIRLLERLIPYAERAWRGSMLQRLAARLTEAVRQVPIKVASALLLGVVFVQTLNRYPTLQETSQTVLAVLLISGITALAGLRVDWTLKELAESRVGRLTKALFEPPEPPNENDR